MKNRVRVILLLLCAVMLIGSAGCEKSAAEDVFTLGGFSISEGEYKYYLSMYKARFKEMYSDYREDDSFYEKEIASGVTAEEYLTETVCENVKMTLVCEKMFDEAGLTLPISCEEAVDEYIESLIDDCADGDRSVFEDKLAEYGINSKELRKIYLRDEKTSYLYETLYRENVTDGDRTEYLSENYAHISHIFVRMYEPAVDSDGYPVYTENGERAREKLTGDALDAKKSLVRAIDESLSAGGDFDEIRDALSEDRYYENGYYLTRTTDFIPVVVDAAFSLDEGEWVKSESEYGIHYVKRLPLGEKPWLDADSADFFADYDKAVGEWSFKKLVSDRCTKVNVNSDVLSKYSVRTSPTNYLF